MRNSKRKDTQEGEHKVRYSTGRRAKIGWRGCFDMFKDVSKEFQAFLRIRRKALPLSSAKDGLQQYLQP